MTKSEITTLKMNIVGGMNEYIKHCGDEEIWKLWTIAVPDECTEDDLLFIAEDEREWRYTCKLFNKLIKKIDCY